MKTDDYKEYDKYFKEKGFSQFKEMDEFFE